MKYDVTQMKYDVTQMKHITLAFESRHTYMNVIVKPLTAASQGAQDSRAVAVRCSVLQCVTVCCSMLAVC